MLDQITYKWEAVGDWEYSLMSKKDRQSYLQAKILFHEEGITGHHTSKGWVFRRKIGGEKQVHSCPVVPAKSDLCDSQGLRDYQIEPTKATVASLKMYGCHLNASDMGTGKTYVSLAAFKELGIEPVVVAPATLLVQWQRVAEHFGMSIQTVSYERLNRKTEFGSWQGSKKFLRFVWKPEIEGIIFDEAHRCKGTSTKASKALVAAARSNAKVAALTATGAASPLEMKAIGTLLGLHDGRHFWDWAQLYGCVPGFHGGFEFSNVPGLMERLHAQIFPSKGCRVKIEDLGDSFPETQFDLVPCSLPDSTTRKIDSLYQDVNNAIEELYERVADWKAPGSKLSQINALMQEIELLKAPAFIDHIKLAVGEGNSVPVFVRFNATLGLIAEGLGRIPYGIFKGVRGPAEENYRQMQLDQFQNDELRVMLTNYSAGATGTSFHDVTGKHPRVAMHSLHYNSRLVRQAFGRVQRDGGKSKSIQKILGASGTIEDEIMARVGDKLHNMDLLNDGDLLPESFSSHFLKVMEARKLLKVPHLV